MDNFEHGIFYFDNSVPQNKFVANRFMLLIPLSSLAIIQYLVKTVHTTDEIKSPWLLGETRFLHNA